MQTEMYNIDDKFFEDVIEYLECEEDTPYDEIQNLPEDYVLEAYECSLEPIQILSASDFVRCIDEDRFSEDGDEEEKLIEIFNKHVDFEAINKEMPKLWYPGTKKMIWTKSDLMKLI